MRHTVKQIDFDLYSGYYSVLDEVKQLVYKRGRPLKSRPRIIRTFREVVSQKADEGDIANMKGKINNEVQRFQGGFHTRFLGLLFGLIFP